MQASLHLNNLDNYALCHLFKWLSPEDLSRTSAVCRRWNAIARDHFLWKPFVEQKLSPFPKPPEMPYWKHYNQHAPGLVFRSLSVLKGEIFSAWGKTIFVWKMPSIGGDKNYDCIRTTTSHTSTITSFALCRLGLTHLLITGSLDKTLQIFIPQAHSRHYRAIQTLHGHTSAVSKIACLGDFILSASTEGEGCLWKCDTVSQRYTSLQMNEKLHSKGIKLLKTASHIFQFITVGKNNCIKFWSVCGGKIKKQQSIKIKDEVISSIAYCHFNPMLLAGTQSGKLLFFKKDRSFQYTLVRAIDAHQSEISAITLIRRDNFLLTAGKDKRVIMWEKAFNPKDATAVKIIHTTEHAHPRHLSVTISNRSRKISKILYPAGNSLCILSFSPDPIKKHCVTATEPHEQRIIYG
ncbi:putative uncharacterized protein [Waddlia chondrophila 2032/99]|uniref:F-box domain-containing protein n=1 Tax=Waddlia chondrophila 2032/99 TaxID=765953 RepID=F8LD05_9BACT|nr:putative uncharacterized protein [Waddlia chondrophila 2032/99]